MSDILARPRPAGSGIPVDTDLKRTEAEEGSELIQELIQSIIMSELKDSVGLNDVKVQPDKAEDPHGTEAGRTQPQVYPYTYTRSKESESESTLEVHQTENIKPEYHESTLTFASEVGDSIEFQVMDEIIRSLELAHSHERQPAINTDTLPHPTLPEVSFVLHNVLLSDSNEAEFDSSRSPIESRHVDESEDDEVTRPVSAELDLISVVDPMELASSARSSTEARDFSNSSKLTASTLTFTEPIQLEAINVDTSIASPSAKCTAPMDVDSVLSEATGGQASVLEAPRPESPHPGTSEAGDTSPAKSAPSIKVLIRTTSTGIVIRRRRRKRLLTRQRQTSSNKANKQKNVGPIASKNREPGVDGRRRKVEPIPKISGKRIMRKIKLGLGKKLKEGDTSEEGGMNYVTPERKLLSTARLIYDQVMYHLGDVIQVTGEDDLIYYAQIQRFLTDEFCERFILIRWLVPRPNIPNIKLHNSDEFNPLYFAQGPYQDEPISMRDIDFVMRAPKEIGFGLSDSVFNQCGEHAVLLNSNIPHCTGTSIARCKL